MADARFKIVDTKSQEVLPETDQIYQVKEWVDENGIVNPVTGERHGLSSIKLHSSPALSANERQFIGLPEIPGGSTHKCIPLVGGLKDGHVVKVPLRKDGTCNIPVYRMYKLRRGNIWYRYNEERDCYEFSEREVDK